VQAARRPTLASIGVHRRPLAAQPVSPLVASGADPF
jgi:hypothetical protein